MNLEDYDDWGLLAKLKAEMALRAENDRLKAELGKAHALIEELKRELERVAK